MIEKDDKPCVCVCDYCVINSCLSCLPSITVMHKKKKYQQQELSTPSVFIWRCPSSFSMVRSWCFGNNRNVAVSMKLQNKEIMTSKLFAEPPQIAPFQFPAESIDEGSFAQVTCSVTKGDEPLDISWHLHGDIISSDPSITTTIIGTRTSILIISDVGFRHSGLYTCRASNDAGTAVFSDELRVNGNALFTEKKDQRDTEGTEVVTVCRPEVHT